MPRKRYPRVRSGEAYTSAGKEEFDNAVAITLNYGGINIGIDEANEQATEYFKAVTKDFNATLKSADFSSVVRPTIKSPGTYKAAAIFPSGFKKKIDADMRQIGSVFADEMKKEIKNVIKTTPGAVGPGRIETRQMLNSVMGRRTEYNQSRGILTASAGWLDTWMRYFGYQEEGTVAGIKPMRAIQGTAMKAFPQLYKVARMYTANFGKRAGFRGFR